MIGPGGPFLLTLFSYRGRGGRTDRSRVSIVKILFTASVTLFDGANTLFDGSNKLFDGSNKLFDGSNTLFG
ncbi:MAG: hypothetical protein LBD64_08190 [Odoribacteraceae bacterium]|nr:hypothetical protein [Odoribacteraceae bacterium]